MELEANQILEFSILRRSSLFSLSYYFKIILHTFSSISLQNIFKI